MPKGTNGQTGAAAMPKQTPKTPKTQAAKGSVHRWRQRRPRGIEQVRRVSTGETTSEKEKIVCEGMKDVETRSSRGKVACVPSPSHCDSLLQHPSSASQACREMRLLYMTLGGRSSGAYSEGQGKIRLSIHIGNWSETVCRGWRRHGQEGQLFCGIGGTG